MNENNFEKMKEMAMSNFANVAAIAPAIMPGVRWSDLTDVTCQCGGNQFIAASAIKLASPLQSKKNMPTLVQLPVGFMCTSCNMVNNFDKAVMEKIMPVQRQSKMREE